MPTFFSLTIFVAAAAAFAAIPFVAGSPEGGDTLTVYTPPLLKQCQEVELSWSNSTGPYNLIVVHADDPCGDPIIDLGNFDNTTTKWKVGIAGGTTVELSLADDEDDEAWSGPVTVAHSDDDSCLPGNSSLSSSASSTPVYHSAPSSSPTPNSPNGSGSVVAPSAIGGVKNAGLSSSDAGTSVRRPAYTPVLVAAVIAFMFASP